MSTVEWPMLTDHPLFLKQDSVETFENQIHETQFILSCMVIYKYRSCWRRGRDYLSQLLSIVENPSTHRGTARKLWETFLACCGSCLHKVWDRPEGECFICGLLTDSSTQKPDIDLAEGAPVNARGDSPVKDKLVELFKKKRIKLVELFRKKRIKFNFL